jgi:hypothetical protein
MIIIDNSNKFIKEEYLNQKEINLNKYVNKLIIYSELRETPISFYINDEEIVVNNTMDYFDSFFESTQNNMKNPADFEIIESNIDYEKLFDNNDETYINFNDDTYLIIKINDVFRLWTKSYETENQSDLLIQLLDNDLNVIKVIDNKEEFKIKNVFTLSSIELNPGIYKFTILPNSENQYIRKDSEWFFERKINLYKSNEIEINKIVETIKYNLNNYFKFEIYTFNINEIKNYDIKKINNINYCLDNFYDDIIWKVEITDKVNIYSDYNATPHIQNVEIKEDEFGRYALIGQGDGGIIGLSFNEMNFDLDKGFYWYAFFGNDENGEYNFSIGNSNNDYNQFQIKIRNANVLSGIFNPVRETYDSPLFKISPNNLYFIEINMINKKFEIYLNGKLIFNRILDYEKTYYNEIFIGNNTKDFNYNYSAVNYLKLYSSTIFNKGLTPQAREEMLKYIFNSNNINLKENETYITNERLIINSLNYETLSLNYFEKISEENIKSIQTKIDNEIEVIEDEIIDNLKLKYNNSLQNINNFEIISFNKFKSTDDIAYYISGGTIKQPIIKEKKDNYFVYTIEPIDLFNNLYKFDAENISYINLKNKKIKTIKQKGNNELVFKYYSPSDKYPVLGYSFELKQIGIDLIENYDNKTIELKNIPNSFKIINNYYGIIEYEKDENNKITLNKDISLIKYQDDINWENDEIFNNFHLLYETKSIKTTIDLTKQILDNENKSLKIKFKAYRIDNWKEDDYIYLKINNEIVWMKKAGTDLIYNDDGSVNVMASLGSWYYCDTCPNYATYKLNGEDVYYGVKGYVDVEIEIPFEQSINEIEIGVDLTNDKSQAIAGFSDFECYLVKNINKNNTLIIPNVNISITNHQNKTLNYNSIELDNEIQFPYYIVKVKERIVGFYYDIKLSSNFMETYEKLVFKPLSKNNPYLPKDCSSFNDSGYHIIYPYSKPYEVYCDKENNYCYIFEHEANKKINYSIKNKIYYNNIKFDFNDENGEIIIYNESDLETKSIEFSFENILEKNINNAIIELEYEGEFKIYIKSLNSDNTYSINYSNIENNNSLIKEISDINTNKINIQIELQPKSEIKITKIRFGIN